MQMTFRWFGKDLDTVSLEQIKQIPGVVGVVPALHYLPAGEAWEMEDVQKMLRCFDRKTYQSDQSGRRRP